MIGACLTSRSCRVLWITRSRRERRERRQHPCQGQLRRPATCPLPPTPSARSLRGTSTSGTASWASTPRSSASERVPSGVFRDWVFEDVSEVLVCYSLRVYESPSNLQSNRVTS